jgi:hypothetical protein
LKQLYAFRAHFNTKKDRDSYRAPKINQDRDAWAMHELVDSLRAGFDVVAAGFNTDAPDLAEASVKARLRAGDLVLTSTRLGMNDLDDRAKTPVFLGNNWLENRILDGWRRYIQWCSRKRIRLTEEGAQTLDPTGRHLTNLKFADTDDASFGSRRGKERHTAGYIVRTKELWPDGPACISVFGVSGTVTFGFASALHDRWPLDLTSLGDSELVVTDISCKGDLVPAAAQGFPDFWKHWTLQIHRRGVMKAVPPD